MPVLSQHNVLSPDPSWKVEDEVRFGTGCGKEPSNGQGVLLIRLGLP